MAFAFDAKSLTVANGGVRRLDLATGDVLAEAGAEAAASRIIGWGNFDPVLAVSVRPNAVVLWDAARLRPLRSLPLEGTAQPSGGESDDRDLVLHAANAPKGDLIAIATPRGLRVVRIRP